MGLALQLDGTGCALDAAEMARGRRLVDEALAAYLSPPKPYVIEDDDATPTRKGAPTPKAAWTPASPPPPPPLRRAPAARCLEEAFDAMDVDDDAGASTPPTPTSVRELLEAHEVPEAVVTRVETALSEYLEDAALATAEDVDAFVLDELLTPATAGKLRRAFSAAGADLGERPSTASDRLSEFLVETRQRRGDPRRFVGFGCE
ncbi:hypothetical protein JL721_3542 [Aureococcus anophagefferens]|nr:hypothetical protein JL721_3542 [Aureococcus anophagefferens]